MKYFSSVKINITPEMLANFFANKRREYEYAKENNLKALEKAVLNAVKVVNDYYKYQPKVTQLELF